MTYIKDIDTNELLIYLMASTNQISPLVENIAFDGDTYSIAVELYPIVLIDIPMENRYHYSNAIRDKVMQLHSLGIYHGDLHEENIVIDGSDVRIIDYGMSKFISLIDEYNMNAYETERGIPTSVQELLQWELDDVEFMTGA